MLYDDWKPSGHLSPLRQLLWSCIHFPFHLTLVLFVGGSAQFIIWFKIIESLDDLPFHDFITIYPDGDDDRVFITTGNITKSDFILSINESMNSIFEVFPARNPMTRIDLTWVENSLGNLSDTFWGNITSPQEQNKQINSEEVDEFLRIMSTLDNVIVNSLFETFHINALDEIEEENVYKNASDFEQSAYMANMDHFGLIVRELDIPISMTSPLCDWWPDCTLN